MKTFARLHSPRQLPAKQPVRWGPWPASSCLPQLKPRLLAPCKQARVPNNNASDKEKVDGVEQAKAEGPSTDLSVISARLTQLILPYWTTSEGAAEARWKLAGVVGLTVATTGVSVVFNFLGRDFFNALSEKNEDLFYLQLLKYLGGFAVGIPVFVFKGYFQNKLALEWRQWMTEKMLADYMANRTFYQLQAQGTVDNPDQRISSDIRQFTDSALSLSLVLLNALIDLVSFSGILYSIYPPLFAALILYSATGTVVSIAVGKNLVTLNFNQEAREADFRYGLVRLRENAESIAFYRGEEGEKALLQRRLQAAVENYLGLLISARNLDFFQSFYRFLIQLLPAAVVAPLFFQGKIEFGVINQSQSAFNHVLNDLSLVVTQFESLAGFSAVVDRLGQFQEASTLASAGSSSTSADHSSSSSSSSTKGITVQYVGSAASNGRANPVVDVQGVTVSTPQGGHVLVENLRLQVSSGESVLLMGPSGAGKTSILRVLAGLWTTGAGSITLHIDQRDVLFLPQRPYMVLGTLREQVLYPRWQSTQAVGPAVQQTPDNSNGHGANGTDQPFQPGHSGQHAHVRPTDEEIVKTLHLVRLGHLLTRYAADGTSSASSDSTSSALESVADWAGSLSLGEQQRLAWARLLLARPQLVLLDEATSALDQDTEEMLYKVLAASGITYISVGHRASLKEFHIQLLELQPKQANGTGWQLKPLQQVASTAEVI